MRPFRHQPHRLFVCRPYTRIGGLRSLSAAALVINDTEGKSVPNVRARERDREREREEGGRDNGEDNGRNASSVIITSDF